ncbi:MAG: nucleotidyltransferase domain-containing protein [Candidatus Shapirobacteria bacterium]
MKHLFTTDLLTRFDIVIFEICRPDYLFQKGSDVDLAILAHQKTDFNFLFNLASQLSHLLHLEVEIQNLDQVSLPFAFRVISTSQVLLGHNSAHRVAFETDLLNRYFDLKDFYQEFDQQVAYLAQQGVLHARPFAY